MSSISGKLLVTTAALCNCVSLFYCTGLPNFIDFLVALFRENRKGVVIVAKQFWNPSYLQSNLCIRYADIDIFYSV